MRSTVMGAALLAGLVACGAGATTEPLSPGDASDPARKENPAPDPAKPLLPLSLGSRWDYKNTDTLTGTVTTKTSVVTGKKPFDGQPGVEVFVLQTDEGATRSIVYVEVKDTVALRHREDEFRGGALVSYSLFTPAALRGPEAMPTSGQVLRDTFTEEQHNPDGTVHRTKSDDYTWNVDSLADKITVPAGTFSAVRVRRVKLANKKEKLTWWVPGIGKIKEVEDRIEELTSYEVK